MFGWFRRNIKRIDAFGVGVEFHPPTADSEAKPSTADAPPLLSSAVPKSAPPGVPAHDLLARDRLNFLNAVAGEKRSDYELILEALVQWSQTRGLRFVPKESKAKKPQFTVSFYMQAGSLFWEVYPDDSRRDAKFCCLSSRAVSEELKKVARDGLRDLSPHGVADTRGKSAPTISFDDLASEEARRKLLAVLDDLLRRAKSK